MFFQQLSIFLVCVWIVSALCSLPALECKLVALFSCLFPKGLASRAGKLHYWGHNHTRTVGDALVASSFAIAKLSPLMHLTDRACIYSAWHGKDGDGRQEICGREHALLMTVWCAHAASNQAITNADDHEIVLPCQHPLCTLCMPVYYFSVSAEKDSNNQDHTELML